MFKQTPITDARLDDIYSRLAADVESLRDDPVFDWQLLQSVDDRNRLLNEIKKLQSVEAAPWYLKLLQAFYSITAVAGAFLIVQEFRNHDWITVYILLVPTSIACVGVWVCNSLQKGPDDGDDCSES